MATAAFVIATLGLLISALALGWQIASWTLEGRRIRVRLLHGTMGPAGYATGPVKRDGEPNNIREIVAEGFTDKEVIGISVTNIGRSPIRVDRYSVMLRRGGFSFSLLGAAIGPELPFRLPPGESESWYADMKDAKALVTTTRSIGRKTSRDVVMSVQLGTGDSKATRQAIRVI